MGGGFDTIGEILIQILLVIQTEAIIDARLGDPYCYNHKNPPIGTLLAW